MSSARRLHLSDQAGGLWLPLDAATRAIVLIGLRGSGKSHTSSVLVEEISAAAMPTCVVDPVGSWWGLRSNATGKGPGLPFIICGGEHADIPLEEASGEVLAEFIVKEGASTVMDLSGLRKNARRRWAENFFETLYHLNRSAMHLVVEEAPMFAPQRADKGAERLLGAMEDIVLRGRSRGLGVTLITQRAATLNKNLLSQSEILIALRQSHNLDIKAIKEWVDVQGKEEDSLRVIRALPDLPTGECFVWSPVLGILERTKIRQRHTFDSSATPAPGQRRVVPKARAEINLDAIRERIASTIEEAKANDPTALRARVAELEQQLRNAPKHVVEIPVIDEASRIEIQALREALTKVDGIEERLRPLLARISEHIAAGSPRPHFVQTPEHAPPKPRRRDAAPDVTTVKVGDSSAKRLVRGERAILETLAAFNEPLTRTQLATLAGLAPNSGSYGTYLSNLRSAGFIETDEERRLTLTTIGAAVAGTHDKPTRADIRRIWTGKLVGGARRMLETLLDVHPAGLSRDELAQRSQLAASSGSFGTYLSTLNSNGLIEKRGKTIYASNSFYT